MNLVRESPQAATNSSLGIGLICLHTTPKTLNQRMAGRRQGCRAWELSPVFLKGLGLKIHRFKTRYFSIAWIEPPSPDVSGKEKVYRIPYRKGVVILVVAVGLLLSGGVRSRTRSHSFLSSFFFRRNFVLIEPTKSETFCLCT